MFGSSTNTGGGVFGSSGGFGSKPLGVGNTLGGGGVQGQDPNSTTKPNPQCPVPTNGTADVPSDPQNPNRTLLWKDERSGEQLGADGKVAPFSGEKLNFDNIIAFPTYWHVSPEVSPDNHSLPLLSKAIVREYLTKCFPCFPFMLQELRVQDYQQGRKTAPAAATTGFGGGFGQSTSTPGFGASGSTAFGQTANTSGGGGLFGAKPATPAGGGGLFGSAGASGTGAFGKPATPAFGQATSGTGGLFGQPAQGATNTFGSAPTAGASGFGGFGQAAQQNKPAFSFGCKP